MSNIKLPHAGLTPQKLGEFYEAKAAYNRRLEAAKRHPPYSHRANDRGLNIYRMCEGA